MFFATVGDVGNDLDPAARQAAVSRIQAGVNRLALALLPCLLAVLDATEQPGPDALEVSYGEAQVPRLLALGYRVQRRPDNRLSIWKTEPDEPLATRRGEDRRVAAARQRLELVQRGGLVGDVQRSREELRAAVRLVEQERQQAATPPAEPAQETQQAAPPAPQPAQEQQPASPAPEVRLDQQQGPTATPEEKP